MGNVIILLLKQLRDDADIFESGTHSSYEYTKKILNQANKSLAKDIDS